MTNKEKVLRVHPNAKCSRKKTITGCVCFEVAIPELKNTVYYGWSAREAWANAAENLFKRNAVKK